MWLEIVLNQSWKSEKMVEATHFYGILAVFRGIPFRSIPFIEFSLVSD